MKHGAMMFFITADQALEVMVGVITDEGTEKKGMGVWFVDVTGKVITPTPRRFVIFRTIPGLAVTQAIDIRESLKRNGYRVLALI